MAIALNEWIRLLGREYLEDFVASGGAAVKLAVTTEENAALEAVESAARRYGYFVATIDAAQTRVHMIDQLFHAVARQVEWDNLPDQWVRKLLRADDVVLSSDQSLRDLDGIAQTLNRGEKADLRRDMRSLIITASLKNYAMSKEFRAAVAKLGVAAITPSGSKHSEDAELVRQWLCGEKLSLTTLKRDVGIFQKIGRHNARMLLGSLAVWLHDVGYAGTVLILDLRPALASVPPEEATVRYGRNTLLDMYELLRQFIDDTDEMAHILIVAIAGPGLVDGPKSVDNYDALKLRIADEVRDRDRANPLNAMVRLDTAAPVPGGETVG